MENAWSVVILGTFRFKHVIMYGCCCISNNNGCFVFSAYRLDWTSMQRQNMNSGGRKEKRLAFAAVDVFQPYLNMLLC